MNAGTVDDTSLTGSELEQAVRSLSSVGAELLESYRTLEQRAARVEQELVRKVAELDAVTRDLEAILDALPTGVLVRDEQGAIVRANGAALEILGVDRERLTAGDAHPLLTEVESGEAQAGWVKRESTGPDGRRLVLASRRSPIVKPDASTAGTVEILDDRTELEQLAEQLHRLDKLAALGNMAGGIAHELRNPLNAVKGFAALLTRRLEAGSKEHHWSTRIVDGVTGTEAILTSLLTLASPEKLVRETVEARELADEVLAMAAGEATEEGAPCPWRLTARCEAPAFVADRIKLRQALRNLVANGMQAQPEGGEVELSIGLEGDELVASVRDAGPGIPEADLRRVLDPFFTTHAEGTGLGLAFVSTIAQLHGGRVEVHSPAPGPHPAGCGTQVSLRFPFQKSPNSPA